MPPPKHALVESVDRFFALLENGNFGPDFMSKVHELLAVMEVKADENKKRQAKGEITINLKFEQEDIRLAIDTEIKVKEPKLSRASTFMFRTDDHDLSLEHPSQHDMFNRAPRPVPDDGDAVAAAE